MATVETFRRIVAATKVATDQEHLHVVIDSDPSIPDRTDALLFDGPDPRPWLAESGNRLLTAGAEIICMPCNTAHAFHSWLQDRLPIPVVHMLKETADASVATGCTRFGLLATAGTAKTGLYQDVFQGRGLTLLTPAEAGQDLVTSTIAAIKAGKSGDEDLDPVRVAAGQLKDQGAEMLVIGCTELSLTAPRLRPDHPLIDALDVLVGTTVRTAFEGGKSVGRPDRRAGAHVT